MDDEYDPDKATSYLLYLDMNNLYDFSMISYLPLNNQDDNVKSCTQNSIRSIRHKVYSIRQTKVALNPRDDKRYILADKINTLPWGHYNIPTSSIISLE